MKEVSDEVEFLHPEEHEGFLQINIMVLIGMVKHSQSSQSSKFAMALQYLKQEVRDGVHFLYADKHQNSIQFGSISTFCPLGPKNKTRKIVHLYQVFIIIFCTKLF